jgi:tetratricopeptide (TPR) repeat protein
VARIDGRLVESLNCCRRASDLFQEIGNMRAATLTLGNLGNSLGELGLLKEAEEALRTVLEIAQKRDLKYLLGGVCQLLCNVMAYQGRLSDAREAGLRSVAVSSEQLDYRFQGYAFIYLSITEFLAADFVKAEAYARQAVQLFEGVPSVQPFASALVARALIGQRRIEEAMETSSMAFRQLETQGGLDDGEVYVRLAYIEALMLSGEVEAGQRLLEKALSMVREKAATIEDPSWRAAFIQNLPENQWLSALAKQTGVAIGID